MSGKTPGLRGRLVGQMGGALVSGLMATTRSSLIAGLEVEREIMDPAAPAIYVLWHGRLLVGSHRYRGRGLGTLISRNRDGDYITPMIERWGYEVIRGSSSRGGAAAMRELVRFVAAGGAIAVTPDGPRGPREKMKIGPFQIARQTGAPIVPVTAGASRGTFVGGWDRFLVPHPFAWCPCAFGEPRTIGPEASDASLAEHAEATERELVALTEMVDEAARGARR